MGGQWYLGRQRRGHYPTERLAIDVDLPTRLLSKRRWKAEVGKAVVPDGQEIIEGLIVLLLWSLDVDDAIARVGVQLVEATAIRCNPNPLGDGDVLPVYVDGEVGVDMVAALLHRVAGHAIDGGMGYVKGQKRLHLQVREADEHEQEDRTAKTAPEEEPGTTTLAPPEHTCCASLREEGRLHSIWVREPLLSAHHALLVLTR